MGTATLRPANALRRSAIDVTPVTFELLAGGVLEDAIPEWDQCAEHAGNAFAQSPWFATTVWNLDVSRRGELCVVAGRDQSHALQAVLPLWLCRSRMPVFGLSTLQPITLFGQETSSILVGAADRVRATASVVDFLLTTQEPQYDLLHFPIINPASDLFAAVVDGAQRHGLPVLVSESETTALITPVQNTHELPGLSSRFRRNLRRAWRRARAGDHKVQCRDVSWDWAVHQEAIARLDRARWGDGAAGSTYALHDEGMQQLIGAMLRRLDRFFRAHAFAAFVDDELAAYVLCFRHQAEVVLWSGCVDDRFRHLSAGMLLWDHCLHEMAAWPGVERITFTKGAERYKLDWSDTTYSVCELAVVRATGLRRRRALARCSNLQPLA